MKHTQKPRMSWLGMSLIPCFFGNLSAQDPTFWLVASGEHQELGSAFGVAGDIDGDGVEDFAVADRSARVNSLASSGSVQILSGADGSLLRTYTGSPASNQTFGSAMATLDANGDGIPDLAVGSPGQAGPSGFGAGAVRIYSGTDGLLISQTIGPASSQLGVALANAGDQNADGFEDLYAGAPLGDSFRGIVMVISGIDGAVLRTILTNASSTSFGAGLAALDDMDSDGLADLAVAGPGFRVGFNPVGRVQIIRSSDSTVAAQIVGSGNYTRLGQSLAPAGDGNGDGLADLLIGSYSGGVAMLVSGADLSVIENLSIATLPTFKAYNVGGSLDFDGDGEQDWLMGSSALGNVGGQWVGGIRVVSGADGNTLFERFASAPFTGLGDFMKVLPDIGFAAGEPALRNPATSGTGAAYIWVLTKDSDGDGIPDDEDSNPNSIMSPYVAIAGVDSGVPNVVDEQGRTTADRLAEIGKVEDYRNGALYFVALLQHAQDLEEEGVFDRDALRKITEAARKGTVSTKAPR